jgi:hypothetical protein
VEFDRNKPTDSSISKFQCTSKTIMIPKFFNWFLQHVPSSKTHLCVVALPKKSPISRHSYIRSVLCFINNSASDQMDSKFFNVQENIVKKAQTKVLWIKIFNFTSSILPSERSLAVYCFNFTIYILSKPGGLNSRDQARSILCWDQLLKPVEIVLTDSMDTR